MYDQADNLRVSRRRSDAPAPPTPEEAARRALERVRKARPACLPGMHLDVAGLRAALAGPLPDPAAEVERLTALGWLAWLDGAFADAVTPLTQAVERAREAKDVPRLAEAAYWLARARLRAGEAEAVPAFETTLRQLGGSPQATAWFVDLLWRAGRIDRAEQVWKSVRGNKRVSSCAEGPLLEARSLLRRGETANAVRALGESTPGSGPLQVERLLLRAWVEAGQGHAAQARELFAQAEALPYPRAALAEWRVALDRHGPGEGALVVETVPVPLRDLLHGLRALMRGEDAVEALRAAAAQPAAAPFARYALAALGHDRVGDVLALQPGMFLTVRCRARVALERFRARQATPAEWLEALRHESRLGYVAGPDAEHYRALAQVLHQPPPADEVRRLVEEQEHAEPAARRNVIRAALELAAKRLPAAEAHQLLQEWSRLAWVTADDELRRPLGRLLLRSALQARATNNPPDPAAVETVRAMMPDEPLLALLTGDTTLWATLREKPRYRPLAQALRLHEAARAGDVAAMVGLMDDADAWRGTAAPPSFALRAVAAVAAGQPTHPAWRRSLGRWLSAWPLSRLGEEGQALAAAAGLLSRPASEAEPPAGVAAAPWFLHQAARALGRDDPGEALACFRRASQADPELADVAADTARAALPALERLARAADLARALTPEGVPPPPAALLTDLADLVREHSDGSDVSALLERTDLPPRLAHHLALLDLRAAAALDEQGRGEEAEPCWRRSWRSWLRFLAEPGDASLAVVDHLLAGHRRRVNDLLARGAVDTARRHWALVQDLPGLAAPHGDELRSEVARRVERFRDELASEYIVATREGMRYGDIPEGWRADYEKGLAHLRRLLSLDRENVRLLGALVEVCGEWFVDLYNAEDHPRLAEQVERFVPVAAQLARRVEGRPGDLAARAALAEYYKFRGFVAGGRAEKVALYREALRFDPANDNVRGLLADLGEPADSEPEGP